ncbi:hypothetical protein F2Q70_00042326 [Brassica cretica]|uniref:Uncharacterized protein n=1 Tax=Brassica cretica TaxID=69181 RepID=A0A8S9KH82_BRACR|nr:hypothetical protein F2Q70_00042326 [Brassica cretica]
MEVLNHVTLQYLSCADPTEAEARKQRVLRGDALGLLEEIAASIIVAATEAAREIPEQGPSSSNYQSPPADSTIRALQPVQNPPKKTKHVPAKFRLARASSKVLRGANSRKRNISSAHQSPVRHQGALAR